MASPWDDGVNRNPANFTGFSKYHRVKFTANGGVDNHFVQRNRDSSYQGGAMQGRRIFTRGTEFLVLSDDLLYYNTGFVNSCPPS